MLAKAKQDVERSQQLLRKGSINLQDLEAQESMVQQLEGTIAADQSRSEQCKIATGVCFHQVAHQRTDWFAEG